MEFNSALNYELPVLKPLAEPMIQGLHPRHPGYQKARELLELLDCFEALDKSLVPADSILQEFIETPS